MPVDNPLLRDSDLPPFAEIRPEHILPAVQQCLEAFRSTVTAISDPGSVHDFEHVLLATERQEERLGRVWAPVSHLHAVADSPALREAYAVALEKMTAQALQFGQHRPLFEAVKAVYESAQFAGLSQAERALVEHQLRDFRLSGVALEEPARTRFREIGMALSKLTTGFEEAVLDATEAWSEHHDTADLLAGLPEAERSPFFAAAEQAGMEGILVTLKPPVVQAVLSYAEDRGLRERVWSAYQTRASDQGPQAGRFDNSERIEQILALRHEAAGLLGYANTAEESLATKMVSNTDTVLSFLRDLAARARPVAEQELETLRRFARTELGLDKLQPWDVGFASERLRKQRFDLDDAILKPYFPLPAVLEGLLSIVAQVFGVRAVPREGVETWDSEVRYLELCNAQGEAFAGLYLDLYARTGKRGGAWMDVCRSRFRDQAEHFKPVAFLTCNFAPPHGDTPALLSHNDVLTLFHEFGHGLHHLLTEVDLPSIGGIDGVEWDAVELPSQLLENFAWNREALLGFARHYRTGQALPEALYQRMLDARHFQAGLGLLRQLEFALFDFLLHREFEPTRGARVMACLQAIRDEVAVLQPPAWARFPHAFTHIFAGGYAAGYYGYLWAEVLAADAFSRFEEAGGLDSTSGTALRREILAVGASRPALESFIAFRGRKPQIEALLRSYGLAAREQPASARVEQAS